MPLIDWHQRADREARFIEWLRRDRWFVDADEAARSRFIFSEAADGRYGTSILGVINGFLPAIGLVLTVCWEHESSRHWLSLKRRWW